MRHGKCSYICVYINRVGDRGSTVVKMLRSLVRVQMSLEFFIDIILPIALWP